MSGFPGAHAGRVALVTGAAAGLGRAYAERLARDGAQVVVADVSDGAATVDTITAAGGLAVYAPGDVTSVESMTALRDFTYSEFGRCDILVNNAGVHPHVTWDELDFDEWRRVMTINLDSMFIASKAFAPGMQSKEFGRIINISSTTVDLVQPGFVHYIASKAGVVGFTRALATELGPYGVTVNAVLPGLTKTASIAAQWEGTPVLDQVASMQAIKRIAVPSDIEGTISFLATDDAAWITGQSIVVDGGQVRH
ncbi:glucose 1-dehydrogenase [Glaciihabitans sp. UYNi722]|uniref:SDR family NAD(P)-dependent oxidoreductase n=1 Tax=Glaciihabitans sp. UYNi722 TaxID=3156344 RepID=UPI00339B4837